MIPSTHYNVDCVHLIRLYIHCESLETLKNELLHFIEESVLCHQQFLNGYILLGLLFKISAGLQKYLKLAIITTTKIKQNIKLIKMETQNYMVVVVMITAENRTKYIEIESNPI